MHHWRPRCAKSCKRSSGGTRGGRRPRGAGGPRNRGALALARLCEFRNLGCHQNDPHRADPKDKIETLHRILRASDLRRAGKYPEAEDLLAHLEDNRARPSTSCPSSGAKISWRGPSRSRRLPEFGKALSLNPTFDQAAAGAWPGALPARAGQACRGFAGTGPAYEPEKLSGAPGVGQGLLAAKPPSQRPNQNWRRW